MNTHDIELPPLPKASKMYDIPGYDEEELKDYALSAIEADRKRRGEPVGYVMPTAIKQLKAGGNAIVGGLPQGGDVAVYLAPQPAEHNIDYKQLYEQMCNRCDSLDAKLAEYERRGEPVYLYRRKGRDEFVTCDKSRYDELSSKPDHFETKVLYTAPQPAEPVKVPSDAEIIALALSSGIRKSEEHWGDRYYTEVGSSLIGFARALLARYGGGTP